MNKAEETFAILVKSDRGYKKETKHGIQFESVTVHKGTLLVFLDSSTVKKIQEKYRCAINYKVADRCEICQSEVFLLATGDSILRITKLQREFLLGVRQLISRMELLKRLQWVESLTVGTDIYVTIATIPTPVKGIIRYIGELPGEEGRKFGIEMMEFRGQGTQDGEFKRKKYFKCDKNCAVFVAMDKITDYDAAKAAKVTKTSGISASKPLARNNHPIKIDDPVTFFDKFNKLYKGVAKWIGTAKSSDTVIIGIEVVDDLLVANIPHHINARENKQLFLSNKTKIFLPITYVKLDTSASSYMHSGEKDAKNYTGNIQEPTKGVEVSNPHNLVVGSAVRCLEQFGVIKWIGTLKGDKKIYAGLEMDDYVDGFGGCDGIWDGVKYFECARRRGKFVLLNSLEPDQRVQASVLSEKASQVNTRSSGVNDNSVLAPDDMHLIDTSSHTLDIGSVIQYGNPPQFGVIKWKGKLPDKTVMTAGLELDNKVDEESSDGVWRGISYYDCKPRRGLFVDLSAVKPGRRPMILFKAKKSPQPPVESSASIPSPVKNPYNLTIGCAVQFGMPANYGVIKWMGHFPDDQKTMYAGLIMDEIIIENADDGVRNDIRYYRCEPKRGKFVPLVYLKPWRRKDSENNKFTDVSEHHPIISRQDSIPSDQNPYKFEVGSTVEYGESMEYGVIKWLGKLPKDRRIFYAGVEMETVTFNYTDGIFDSVQYFESHAGKGKFIELQLLKPDKRFVDNITPQLVFDVGSKVQFGKAKECGVIKWIGNVPQSNEERQYVKVETEGRKMSALIPLSQVSPYIDNSSKGEPDKPKVTQSALRQARPFSQLLEPGSMVEFGNPVQYGTIKRIEDHISSKKIAEIETENYKQLKIPLDELKPDNRLNSVLNTKDALKIGEPNLPPSPAQPISPVLEVGSTVEFGNPVQYGIVQWIKIDPVVHKKMVGLKLEDSKDVAVPLYEVRPDSRLSNDLDAKAMKITKLDDTSHVLPRPVWQTLEVGSMVQFGNPVQYGVIKLIKDSHSNREKLAGIETEDQEYKEISLVELQPDSRFISNVHLQEDNSNTQQISPMLEIGSLVQFGDPAQYGVIKKIEINKSGKVAEVETELNELKKILLVELQPDNRFIVDVNTIEGQLNPLEKEFYTHEENLFPVPPANKFDAGKHTDVKGIQGYKNSCYLDATLYGMFMFSDAFDILILEDVATNAEELKLQKRLKCEIVYPLRKKGIVVQNSIGDFREHLAQLQNMKGLTSEEKDPEEFLNLLFKHVLHLDPFLLIRRPSGIDKEFFIQLFVEPQKDEPAINTERLLYKMFQEQNINFAKYPTRLLLQMPRYGKRFKSFQRIIPSLQLNVTPLCMASGLCCICKGRMGFVCNDCSHQRNQMQCYCSTCSLHWHQNHCDHIHELYNNNDFDTGILQLLCVLCIETSHYVCFTRITGSGKDEWVFFDSMAERQDNGYNLPKVIHCTDQLQEHVYGEKDINEISSKQLPELVRRFVQDAYLCIYVDHDGVMYQ